MNLTMAVVRAVHLATCLIAFGMDGFAFLILSATPREPVDLPWRRLRRIVMSWTLPTLIVSGVVWFVLVALAINDPPLTTAGVRLVLFRTHFGRLWQLRSVFALAVVGGEIVVTHKWRRRLSPLFTGALLASVAWAGHAQLGPQTTLHLAIDITHLLIAGIWPIGLLPLVLMLANKDGVAEQLDRFSRVSTVCVIVLFGSGVVNAVLTLDHARDLLDTRYGIVLTCKVVIVAMMVAIGAQNRRDVRRSHSDGVRGRVILEIGMAIVVLFLTGLLGMLEP